MSFDPTSRPWRTSLGLLGVAIALLPALGCAPDATQTSDTTASTTASPAVAAVNPADYRHADELGEVPVMEYHRVGPKEGRWTRTYDHFRQDLEFFYHNGYHLVTMRDVVNRKSISSGTGADELWLGASVGGESMFMEAEEGR